MFIALINLKWAHELTCNDLHGRPMFDCFCPIFAKACSVVNLLDAGNVYRLVMMWGCAVPTKTNAPVEAGA